MGIGGGLEGIPAGRASMAFTFLKWEAKAQKSICMEQQCPTHREPQNYSRIVTEKLPVASALSRILQDSSWLVCTWPELVLLQWDQQVWELHQKAYHFLHLYGTYGVD